MPINKTKHNNSKYFGFPGAFAQARNQAGGDWAAGLLLYRIRYRWAHVKKKLKRFDREWLAMSRSDWAREAGLSESEMKNRALPKLRKFPYIEIRAMKLSEKKLLWVNFDPTLCDEHMVMWDYYDFVLNGIKPIGHVFQPDYPYKNPDKDDLSI